MPQAEPKFVSFVCKRCETRMYAKLVDVGRGRKCPDCGTVTGIPSPPVLKAPSEPTALQGKQFSVWSLEDQPDAAVLRAREIPTVSFACELCETRLTTRVTNVGKLMRCPDCGSKTRIPRPKATPPPSGPQPTTDDLYELDEAYAPVAPPERLHTSIHNRFSEDATSAHKKSFARPDSMKFDPATAPKLPLLQGLFAFATKRDAIVRIIAFGIMLVINTFLFQVMLSQISTGSMIFGACLLPVVTFLCSISFSVVSACWLVIFQESADGHYIIEEWPGRQFNDWMFDGLYVLTAAIVSVIPGWAFYRYGAFSSNETAIIGVLAFAVLFPIALLSELEASSVMTVLSTRILWGMFRAPVAWFFFYVLSMFWCIMLFFSSTWLLTQSRSWLYIIAPIVVFGTFVYFRLLGRLGWCLARAARTD